MFFKQKIYPYLFVIPLILLMFGLVFYPAILTFIESFKSLKLTMPDNTHFIGFSNYLELLRDPDVLISLKNTFWYYLVSVVFGFLGGLLIALVLRENFKGRAWMLAIVILPWAIPPVVSATIWKLILDPTYGPVNQLLTSMGIIQTSSPLLAKPGLAIFIIALVHVWKMIPLVAIILLAALQAIPKEIYQASQIDGAGPWKGFLHITLPLLKPAIAIVLTQATISSINLFDEIYVLTGTALDTRSIMTQNYLIAFRQLDLGLGMALSFLTTIIILVISLIYFAILGKRGDMN
ncbi:carbohydrate ABC transporter permease [Sporosarcina sp. 6E9]|uniref:carbohydrate ABC transporter permease n=1 Tax=Sporosarcina sp. 6E9 TaxID=2819235 RepID=UPI001B300B03|nr:sugar ABC transporter permease [Sporosarcina sp. 6E9]